MFRCSNGHEWVTCFVNIEGGSWCPECQIRSTTPSKNKNKLLQAEKIAEARGGKLISHNNNLTDKLTWQCLVGHQWQATYQNVTQRNSWCPYCKSSFSENICRSYFEYIFDKKFPKARFDWLLSDKGYPMELDGFCQELSLAFEHQGLQHYSNVTSFDSSLEDIQKRDSDKRTLCKDHSIKLIEIPALFYLTKLEDFHLVIRDILDGYQVSYDTNKIKPVSDILDLNYIRTIEYKNELENIKEIAKSHGGICRSELYTGYNCDIDLTCELGHEWTTKAFSLKKGSWCPVCSHKTEITIEFVKDFAKSCGVECLSEEYTRNTVEMDWFCPQCSNKWKLTYNNFQYRKGCPKCNRVEAGIKRKNGIEIYKEVAKKKGGLCLSLDINSCFDKLEFECAQGHRWFSRADQIKNTKKWCPVCSKKKQGNFRKAA